MLLLLFDILSIFGPTVIGLSVVVTLSCIRMLLLRLLLLLLLLLFLANLNNQDAVVAYIWAWSYYAYLN